MIKLIPLLLAAGTLFAANLKPLDEPAYTKMVASSKGKVVLVNFWATYCVPCRKEMPALVAMQARLAARGFQLITVSADEPEQEKDAAAFLDKAKVAAPVYIKRVKDDDKFINSLDPKWSGALPASFLYDKSGKKVKSYFGEADLKQLEADVLKLL
ncbi:MAG TPA: TlpA disulfide reductase family protein [Bryobacteraceae bacterium]|nr:TlpA disulfide reductase family protein [Bryobacteraceae bacterium]